MQRKQRIRDAIKGASIGLLALACSSGSSGGYSPSGSDGVDEPHGVDEPYGVAGPTPDALADFGGVRTCAMTAADCQDLRSDGMDQC